MRIERRHYISTCNSPAPDVEEIVTLIRVEKQRKLFHPAHSITALDIVAKELPKIVMFRSLSVSLLLQIYSVHKVFVIIQLLLSTRIDKMSICYRSILVKFSRRRSDVKTLRMRTRAGNADVLVELFAQSVHVLPSSQRWRQRGTDSIVSF